MSCTREFEIAGDDFASAGRISTEIKAMLKSVGYPSDAVRRLAIATYEAEMNVVLYAHHAHLTLTLNPEDVRIVIQDEGPGIPDIPRAMQEGFSTATDKMREKGFGAGMGLPNIRRNTDTFEVTSEVGRGTRLVYSVHTGAVEGVAP